MSRDATLYIDDMIEACRRVTQDTEGLGRAQWRRIAGLRDVLAHAYFGIDDDVVWSVVVEEVPVLLPRLVSLRARL